MNNNPNDNLVTILYNNMEIQVTHEIADYLEESRREQARQDKSNQRHLSDKFCNEDFIEEFLAVKPLSLEEIIIQQEQFEELTRAIAVLSRIQRRRLIAYYYENLTYQDIANREHVAINAVNKSIKSALDKLRKILDA